MTVEQAPVEFDGQVEARLSGVRMALGNVTAVAEHWRQFYETNPTPQARESLVKVLSLKYRLTAIEEALQS